MHGSLGFTDSLARSKYRQDSQAMPCRKCTQSCEYRHVIDAANLYNEAKKPDL